MIRYIQISSNNLAIQLLIVLASVRKLATEEGKEQDTRSIDVSWWTAEFNLSYYLRSHV